LAWPCHKPGIAILVASAAVVLRNGGKLKGESILAVAAYVHGLNPAGTDRRICRRWVCEQTMLP